MKCLLSVSLATLAVAANFALTGPAQTPELQKGVSVQMAATNNASAVPEADDANAWIVTVTANGNLYFGIHPVTLNGLEEQMAVHPRNREQNLYIKADARTPYANVQKALDAAREAMFETPVLLTSQAESPAPGTIVPPKGLQVLLDTPPSYAPVIVQLGAARSSPTVEVNGQPIGWQELHSTLDQLMRNRSQKAVRVEAPGTVQFMHIAQAVDAGASVGATVILAPGQL